MQKSANWHSQKISLDLWYDTVLKKSRIDYITCVLTEQLIFYVNSNFTCLLRSNLMKCSYLGSLQNSSWWRCYPTCACWVYDVDWQLVSVVKYVVHIWEMTVIHLELFLTVLNIMFSKQTEQHIHTHRKITGDRCKTDHWSISAGRSRLSVQLSGWHIFACCHNDRGCIDLAVRGAFVKTNILLKKISSDKLVYVCKDSINGQSFTDS